MSIIHGKPYITRCYVCGGTGKVFKIRNYITSEAYIGDCNYCNGLGEIEQQNITYVISQDDLDKEYERDTKNLRMQTKSSIED